VTKLSAHGGLSGQVPNLGAYPDKCPWALFLGKTVARSAITFLMMYLNFVLRSNSCRQALFDFRCWTTLDYDSETLNANHIRFQLLSVKISSLPLM